MSEWKYYFPDDGETEEDARTFKLKIFDAQDAADIACKYDYEKNDGWERGENEFKIAIITPDGTTQVFCAWHEHSVEHITLLTT